MEPEEKQNALTKRIKETALALGFHRVGITSSDPVESDQHRFAEWLADGFSGEMAYLAKDPEIRSDPKRRFPEARSVVCLALSYYRELPSADPSTPPSAGKVARYAWGEDYHKVIEEKLERLIAAITALGGRCWKGYVDHGPLLERAFAQRAGIGFIGKNTNLITSDYGSWVFLAEVVSDLDLTEDLPETSQCGSCRICIDACPTGALTEAYRLDARRCIAYLTIENKGPIPEEFLPQMEGWLFGCDICQEVCPYNSDPIETDEARLSPERGAGSRLPIGEIEALSDKKAFQNRFGETPLARAKWAGLLRNAAALQKSKKLE
ncbi:MAG TPA: tRNA epoxyqueuosine(34) reductase QueG [Candidatus Manganitrophaceae bacterium]|nr:tRNA epoxyqueuosine(34) reductase QueG [Candidatus Manganitrophaceae bacterium]